jgi:2-keto-3-deoxy-L-rhamnonate aldolase RhmA
MTAKEMKKALREGIRVYGTLIVSPSPRWLDIVKSLDVDFVFIDTEHIAIDYHQLSWMCHGYEGKNCVPIVRIPSPDPYQACKVLDAGAKGIVAPYIETVDEVQALRGAVKVRPLKGKKLNEYLSGKKDLEPELAVYIEKNNENNILIINIESQAAIDNLDELLKVPGLDAVLIGPHDLSCNLGIPEQYTHPKFLAAVEKIITTARRSGIGAGMHVFYVNDVNYEIQLARMGANLILHSGDINRFNQIMSADIKTMRLALSDQVKESNFEINI